MGAWRRLRGRCAGLVVAGGLAGITACAGPNLWTDWTSVSTGHSNRGRLRHPAKMPTKGEGFEVPKRWAERGNLYGVDELLDAVQRAAVQVRGADETVKLGIADVSPLRGGRSRWHRSHQSGRDIDLIFYSVDEEGANLDPPTLEMIHYNGDGEAYEPKKVTYEEASWDARRFDDARNWRLMEALLGDPTIRLQWVFVSEALKGRLLSYAAENERPTWAIEYAKVVLRQPADAPPHDDHFHVRIYCSRADRFHGCVDRGPVWHHEKKTYKYGGAERYDPVRWRMAVATPVLAGLH
jgi:penicillin-insensitive murein endopeptidase